MPVTVVAVAASRIDLPDLHQGATDRAAALLQDPPGDHDPLPQRHPTMLDRRR